MCAAESIACVRACVQNVRLLAVLKRRCRDAVTNVVEVDAGNVTTYVVH